MLPARTMVAMARGGVERGDIVVAEPLSFPMTCITARLRRELRMGHGSLGSGEIDHRLRIHDGVERIAEDRDVHSDPGPRLAEVLARTQPCPSRSGDGDEMGVIALPDGVDQLSGAHPSRRAHHRNANAAPPSPVSVRAIPTSRLSQAGLGRKRSLASGRRMTYLRWNDERLSMAKNRASRRRRPVPETAAGGRTDSAARFRAWLARGDVHDPELNAMSITVGEVRTSPDLKIATVYVMPLGGAARAEAIDALKRNRGRVCGAP